MLLLLLLTAAATTTIGTPADGGSGSSNRIPTGAAAAVAASAARPARFVQPNGLFGFFGTLRTIKKLYDEVRERKDFLDRTMHRVTNILLLVYFMRIKCAQIILIGFY